MRATLRHVAIAALACSGIALGSTVGCQLVGGIGDIELSAADGGQGTGSDTSSTGPPGTGLGKDTGTDTRRDAGPEKGPDAALGGHDSGDASIDSSAAAVAFPATVAQAYCARVSECCVGDAGAMFDMNGCLDDQTDLENVPLTNLGLIHYGLPSSSYTFDPTAAAKCIADITGLACTASAAALTTVLDDCSGAYQPRLSAGSTGCTSSLDCVSGTYCAPVTLDKNFVPQPPAGGGTCTLLVAAGQPCVDTSFSSDCSYRGAGTPAAYCGIGTDGASVVCMPRQQTGTTCENTMSGPECQSLQCFADAATNSTYTCVATVPLTVLYGTDLCTTYAVGGE